MKDKKTVIMLAVKNSTIMDKEKTEEVNKKIFDEIITPFNCDPRFHSSKRYNNEKFKNITTYHIFKEGWLKKSVQFRLMRKLDELRKYWPALMAYRVETIRGDGI